MSEAAAPFLETARLILRPHVPGDFEPCHAIWSDPAVTRHIGGRPATREESWARLLRYAGHWQLLGHGVLAVIEKAGGRLVGETGLADFRRGLGDRFDPYREAAWVYAADVHRRGYATEAMAALLARDDADRPGARTVCIIHPDNLPSLRTAARLGYAPFGEATYKNGRC